MHSPERVAAVRASQLLDQGTEEAFDRISQLAAAILGAPLAFLSVLDDVNAALKGSTDSTGLCGPDGTLQVPARDAPCRLVVDTGEELVVGDVAADPRLRDLPQVKAFNAAAWVGIPVVDPDAHVLGNLCAVDTRSREWTETELTGLRTLAAAVNDAIAIRFAAQTLRTYAEQATELADVLQQSLLPLHPPGIPGIAVATRFSAGGTSVEVLGDFYDIVPSGSGTGSFGVIVGDVCGKGPTAARTTALARSAVRTAAHTETDPVAVLGTVHDVLLDWFGAGRSFVTAVYAAFTKSGVATNTSGQWHVRVASAGHPPGFVRSVDGRVDELRAGGRVLGLTTERPTGLDTLTLGPGDALVLYTDGISEARDPAGVQLDGPGIAAALEATPYGAGAEQLADALVDAARHHAGQTNTDDLAVVVIRIEPTRAVGP